MLIVQLCQYLLTVRSDLHFLFSVAHSIPQSPDPKSPTRPSFQQYQPTASSLPPDLILLSTLFPFPPDSIRTDVGDFLPQLPPYPRAQFLVQSYFEQGAWRYVSLTTQSHLV